MLRIEIAYTTAVPSRHVLQGLSYRYQILNVAIVAIGLESSAQYTLLTRTTPADVAEHVS